MKKLIYILIIFFLIEIILLFLDKYEKEKFKKKFPPNINTEIDKDLNISSIKKESYIPKIIYRTCSKKYIKNFEKSIEKTKENMKNYEQKIYFDDDIINFIKDNYPEDVLYLYNRISNDYFPAKTDLFRYLLIYKLGGIYLDVKTAIIKNIDSIIEKNGDKLLLIKGREKWRTKFNDNFFIDEKLSKNHNWSYFSGIPYGEYNNWFIASPRGNPLLMEVILQTLSNIKNGLLYNYYIYGEISVLALSGPLMYTKVITKHKDKNNYKIFEPNLNNSLVYNFVDHKKIMGDEHYKNKKNKNVLKNI